MSRDTKNLPPGAYPASFILLKIMLQTSSCCWQAKGENQRAGAEVCDMAKRKKNSDSEGPD